MDFSLIKNSSILFHFNFFFKRSRNLGNDLRNVLNCGMKIDLIFMASVHSLFGWVENLSVFTYIAFYMYGFLSLLKCLTFN